MATSDGKLMPAINPAEEGYDCGILLMHTLRWADELPGQGLIGSGQI